MNQTVLARYGEVYLEDADRVTQVGSVVPQDLSDTEIVAEIIRCIAEAHDIDRQIKDDADLGGTRAEGWVLRARAARRHIFRTYELARGEAVARGLTNVPDIDPNREAKRQLTEHLAETRRMRKANRAMNERHFREAEVRRAERVRQHEIAMREEPLRRQAAADVFFAAAKVAMTKDDRSRVWDHAKAMFPDSPVFAAEG